MPRNGDTEITRDPYCREHGHSRWQYKEGHPRDVYETELREPERSEVRYRIDWTEPVWDNGPEPIPYTITIDHETRTIAIDNATWGAA